MGCICIKDRFGDVHARRIDRAEPKDIEREARELADDICETIKVGLCATDDSGAARLRDGVDYTDGGIEWLYELEITVRVSPW